MTPVTSEATNPRSAAVEAAVLDAAAHLLVVEGPHALSVRRIATAAGVAPASIYNRFESKGGVLDALFVRGFDRLHGAGGSAVAAACEADASPAAVLAAYAIGYRRFALDEPGTYALMFDGAVAEFEPSEAGMVAADGCFSALREMVVAGQEAGEIVAGDADEVAQRVWDAVHGAVSLERHGICFAPDPDQHFAALVATVLTGLRPDRGVPGGGRPGGRA